MKGRDQQYPARMVIQYPLLMLIMDATIGEDVPVSTYVQQDAFLHGKFLFMPSTI